MAANLAFNKFWSMNANLASWVTQYVEKFNKE